MKKETEPEVTEDVKPPASPRLVPVPLAEILEAEYTHGLYFGYCVGFLTAFLLICLIRGEK